ncbi:MAG: biopolymer transporter ExbD [Planctomycetota bacterium]|nr:biopolymer transporter ExbD [Planctomycetota bacterium]
MRSLSQEEESFDIPLTPLIDVVFLLLIFFLVVANVSRPEIDQTITLPAAGNGAKTEWANSAIVLNLRRDETLVVNGRVVALAELPRRLAEWREKFPQGRAVMRGDADTNYAQVMSVLSVCRAAGIEQVDLPAGSSEVKINNSQ